MMGMYAPLINVLGENARTFQKKTVVMTKMIAMIRTSALLMNV